MFGASSPRSALTAVSVLPVTGLCTAIAVSPYPAFRPYSKTTVVLEPFAFTVPLTVAPVVPIPVAAPVVAVGDCAKAGPVKASAISRTPQNTETPETR